jgi:hypothetical protein
MTIRVMYHDGTYDMVSVFTLEKFIRDAAIKGFYRTSEDKWITIGVDPIRTYDEEGRRYGGAERRMAKVIERQLL